MGFTKITQADLNSRGCTTLPNQPEISAQALKEEFDAPAKEIVAPKVNNLIDELEAETAAASIGAVAPSGMTGNTVQAILDELAQGGGGGGTTVIANPSGTATSDLSKLQVGTTIYGIPEGGTDVEANPSGSGTTDLTKLKVENTIYNIPSGSTTVVANPEDEATVELEKLKIGSTTYSVSGGSIINFSTSEQLTGRKWINGNDIYEKTVPLATLPSNTSATYPHSIGGIGIVCYYHGIKNDSNVFTDLLVDNDVEIDGTNVTLTSDKAQTGKGYITIGYTKPVGGYYPNNQYYAKETGQICTGWYAEAAKTVVGDCYSGMIVGLRSSQLYWTTFCISLLQATVQGMDYRYGVIQDSLTFNGQTWFYSYSQVQVSYASSTNLDNTQPPERRFYIGEFPADANFVETALLQLLDSIYT